MYGHFWNDRFPHSEVTTDTSSAGRRLVRLFRILGCLSEKSPPNAHWSEKFRTILRIALTQMEPAYFSQQRIPAITNSLKKSVNIHLRVRTFLKEILRLDPSRNVPADHMLASLNHRNQTGIMYCDKLKLHRLGEVKQQCRYFVIHVVAVLEYVV